MKQAFLIGAITLILGAYASDGFAAPAFSQQLSTEHSDRVFFVPPALRGRVDFWKDVFTKYGKFQQIIHHREFPQVRFGVIDLSLEGQSMNPVDFERYKKSESDRRVKDIHRALEKLAKGERPSSLLEDIVMREMKTIPGGTAKYRRAVDEDLVRTQTGIKERYAEAVKRAGRYMPILEQIFVKEFGLPRELTRLPFVESSFDYTAYSSVGAAGIWQFMPRTGRSFGMIVNSLVDERRDPITATRGAAKYLAGAYRELGNWPLALTSYNHGVGGVRKKVKQFGTSDIVALIEHSGERPFGFASSNFYPEFLAAVEIYRDWRDYFPGLEVDQALNLRDHQIASSMGVHAAARQVGVDVESLRGVNYALSSAVWSGRAAIPRGYILRVPQGDTVAVARERGADLQPQPKGPSASSVYGGLSYKVRQGDTLISIAKRFNVSVSAIKEQNQLGKIVSVGQELIIRPTPKQGASTAINKKTRPASVVREPTYYTVKKGDTLGEIAAKSGVSTQALKNQNRIRSNTISVGQRLKIP